MRVSDNASPRGMGRFIGTHVFDIYCVTVCQHGQRHNSQGHNAPCRYVERHAARFENIVRQQRKQKWLDWLGEGNPQLGSTSNLKVESGVSI